MQRKTARKQHTCASCGKKIKRGEAYYKDVIRDTDGVDVFIYCEVCGE